MRGVEAVLKRWGLRPIFKFRPICSLLYAEVLHDVQIMCMSYHGCGGLHRGRLHKHECQTTSCTAGMISVSLCGAEES